ncbi:putative ribonuclease H-like domain-containing protein [Tanacetum coccineum]|uniref:Ribonuclease H-like domain-containing protein n=1 Tax=Tanacetum coccineum TaxID=301880 RepID=A0ABQ4XD97_9ASTR
MPALVDISIFNFLRSDEDDDAGDDMNNLDTTIQVSPNPTTRIHKDHPLDQVIGDLQSATQTRNMSKNLKEHGRTQKGYTQEEEIDYDEVFAPVARIEATRLFLAYASFKGFVVYQMDVKHTILYGKIEEEVYVCQPPGFKDPDFPHRVYKVEKALYGLHQAPRAWYKSDVLLVQVYMDDIIFSSTKKELCNAFETLMHEKFQMSSMGELTFFLGLQVQQKKDGIFINQDKYVGEILKKFGFTEVKTASTPMRTQKPLFKDEDGEEVDVHMYRSMIGSLMYLTSSRPGIMFAVCACARYQVNLKVSHLRVKGFLAYTDSDYARASLDRKSTTGGCQFLRSRLISWQCKKQTVVANSITEAEYVAASSCYGQVKTVNGEVQLQALVDGKKIIITESTLRRDLQLEDAEGVDCLPNATIFEQLTLMGYEKISQKLTFYKAFFSPQWKFLIHTNLQCLSSKTTAWNEFSSTMASAIICLATNQKFNFSKYIFESMVKNLDNAGKFLMYPRFIQVFLDKQLEGMPTHNRIYIAPSHTKKIFGNMRRIGKGFSGRETPLFQTMVKQRLRKPKRKDIEIPQSSGPTDNVVDEAVNEEMDDSLERAATTATSLDAEQDRGNINKTQSKATPNEAGSQGSTSSGGPRHQETMGDTIAQTRFENVSKTSNDLLLARGNTLQSGEDSLKLNELIELCTTLQQRVLDLETTKTTQANEIASLKRRVKKLEKRNKSRTHGLKRMYRGRIADIDANKDIYLVNVHTDADMLGVNDLDGDEVIVDNVDVIKTAKEATTTATITDVEITLAQALAELKSAKPKAVKDKGKGIMIKEPVVEQVKPMKRLEQIRLDKELAFKLQAEEEEEERLAREKLIKLKKLQAQEQEELTDEEKARLFVQFLEQRRKHFAAKRAEEKRNRPPTRAKQRSIITELVEESSKKAKAEIAQESSSKRAEDELEQENAKKQKMDENKETVELQRLIEVVPDEEEVAINAISLATKPPTIVDWKIHKEGKKSYYQIIRADGKSQIPVEDLDLIQWGDLKKMFKPHVKDQVWRNQYNYSVLDWKLYDSCRVHSLRKQNVYIHMLVEKRYPLTPATITAMLNKKLQADHFSEMAYQLLKLLTKQLKNQ